MITFPAWDCLPYDRASPSLRATSERLAALHRCSSRKTPQLGRHHRQRRDPAHADAVPHPPARRRRSRRASGSIAMRWPNCCRPTAMSASETVARRGNMPCAAGWSICSRRARASRCGSISSATRSRASANSIPEDQRTTARVDGFTLLPASETLLDADSIKRFRTRYRERFGATATGDPLYQAISDGRRLSGMEHWLPCSRRRWRPLFDHLSVTMLLIRDAGVDGAAERVSTRSPIITTTASARSRVIRAATARSPRPLYLTQQRNGARWSPIARSI
jgi:transcription-repair coupling factor (superfamily II helicase)